MKNKFAIAALVMAVSFGAMAVNENGQGSNSNSVNSNNSSNAVKIYENTSAGKARAEWSKDRVVNPCDSIQNKNPAFSRGTNPPKCDKL